MEKVTLYTASPKDYDYSYTDHVGFVGVNQSGRLVRRVAIREDRVSYQCGRYSSGLFTAINHEEFVKQVQCGLIKPLV